MQHFIYQCAKIAKKLIISDKGRDIFHRRPQNKPKRNHEMMKSSRDFYFLQPVGSGFLRLRK